MSYPIHDLVGGSPELAAVIELIGKVARFKANVLLEGESGTGKELAAHAIHRNSPRSNGPFVSVNCAALPEELLENELFGHEKGAFTGALAKTKGKFEVADGGTLFLDEIGEISWRMQAKLLRAVEYREVQRIGGAAPIRADIRLVAATNRDLHAAMGNGKFREDLYYRLNVLHLRMPALRDRREDIPALARHFLSTMSSAECERIVKGISAEAESLLCNYYWPGNVRQLKHVIERAIALASGDTVQPQDLPAFLLDSVPADSPAGPETLEEAVFRLKRQFVENVVETVNGNLTKAAAILEKHPAGLSRMLDTLDLSHLKKPNRKRYGAT